MTSHTHESGRTGALLAVAGASLWGTTGTSQALLVGHHSPVAVGGLRATIAATALLAGCLFIGGGPAVLRTAASCGRWRWLLTGGLAMAAYQLTFFAAVARTGVGIGALVMLVCAPGVAGLLGWALNRERPSRMWLVSTLVGLVGAALLVLGSSTERHVAWDGLMLAGGAGASFALYAVAARAVAVPAADGTVANGRAPTAIVFVVASLALVVPLGRQDLAFATHPRSALVLLWLGLVATAGAYLLYQAGMRHVGAGTAATLALAEPMVANILAVVVLHEPFTALMGVGVALVLVGLALAGRA